MLIQPVQRHECAIDIAFKVAHLRSLRLCVVHNPIDRTERDVGLEHRRVAGDRVGAPEGAVQRPLLLPPRRPAKLAYLAILHAGQPVDARDQRVRAQVAIVAKGAEVVSQRDADGPEQDVLLAFG